MEPYNHDPVAGSSMDIDQFSSHGPPSVVPWSHHSFIPPDEMPTTSTFQNHLIYEGFVPHGSQADDDSTYSGQDDVGTPFGDYPSGPATPSPANDGPTEDADHDADHDVHGVIARAQRQFNLQLEAEDPQIETRRRRGRPQGVRDSHKRARRGTARSEGKRGGWSKGLKLGPRPTLEPSPEFNALHQQALHAFMYDQDNEKAKDLVIDAININPEIYAAHALLAEIYFSFGDDKNAINTLWVGAHVNAKDPAVWHTVVDACLQRATYHRRIALEQARYAYNKLCHLNPSDPELLFRRAECDKELGAPQKCINTLNHLLQEMPHNSDVLRLYAEACIDFNNTIRLEPAIALYKEAVQHYQIYGLGGDDTFEWSDISAYVDLLVRKGRAADNIPTAILVFKKLSRWLLGRESETYWNKVTEDDREFDADDDSRRLATEGFQPGGFLKDQYGNGLPMEQRVQLGLLRLRQADMRSEAIAHFDWLEPNDEGDDAKVVHYPDLFYEVGMALYGAKEHQQALRYFEALHRQNAFNDLSFWNAIGTSSIVCGRHDEAMEYLKRALAIDKNSVAAKTQVARIHLARNDKEKAIQYASEAVEYARSLLPKSDRRKYEKKQPRLAREAAESVLKQARKMTGPKMRKPRKSKSKKHAVDADGDPDVVTSVDRDADLPADSGTSPEPLIPTRRSKRAPKPRLPFEQEPSEYESNEAQVDRLYPTLVNNTHAMRTGDNVATSIWMDCAETLVRIFRSTKVFFPRERHMKFLGYDQKSRQKTQRKAWQKSGQEGQSADATEDSIPEDYCGIPFTDWLEIFLEYAILLANQPRNIANRHRDCYTVLEAAINANIWHTDPPSQYRIHIVYLSCALALDDQHRIFNKILRFFIREFIFCTDAYRLFSAINLLFKYPNDKDGKLGQNQHAASNHSSNNKFIWRHLTSVDHTLPDDYDGGGEGPVPRFMRASRQELLSVYRKDDAAPDGKSLVGSTEMDVVLLAIYGQMVYAAGSFDSALSYFYRARALDPNNTLVLMTISLCYIHLALRKAIDAQRQMLVLQGWAWFEEYADTRTKWAEITARETGLPELVGDVRREVEFNRGRCWDVLGIADLAVRSYGEALRGGEDGNDMMDVDNTDPQREPNAHGTAAGRKPADFEMDAAYAMATTYAMNGDMEMAREITEKYLVVE